MTANFREGTAWPPQSKFLTGGPADGTYLTLLFYSRNCFALEFFFGFSIQLVRIQRIFADRYLKVLQWLGSISCQMECLLEAAQILLYPQNLSPILCHAPVSRA